MKAQLQSSLLHGSGIRDGYKIFEISSTRCLDAYPFKVSSIVLNLYEKLKIAFQSSLDKFGSCGLSSSKSSTRQMQPTQD